MANLTLAVLAAFSYLVALACYRIYFHPISHIPGPKLAAVTYWYQSYYDVWPHWGRFLWKARDLHAQYGPIVRVGPNEVQIIDTEFYSEMYSSGSRRRDKSELWFWMTGWTPFTLGMASFPVSVFVSFCHDSTDYAFTDGRVCYTVARPAPYASQCHRPVLFQTASTQP